MRYIPDDVQLIERNGYIFLAHPFRRYDAIVLSLAATVAGSLLQTRATLQQGKAQEQIAEQRAVVDIKNAEAVRAASIEEAAIKKERGVRLLATQKARAAAGGIRVNVGAPLVIEAETNALLAKDIGFGLERGRTEAEAFLVSAGIERATGVIARKRSRFSALSQGLLGISDTATRISDAGLFKKKPKIPTFGAPTFPKVTHTGGFLA